MSAHRRSILAGLVASIFLMPFSAPSESGQIGSGPAAAGEIIACRVLEAHTSPKLPVSVVVFHQQGKNGKQRLGDLLRRHSGESAEIQTSGGAWQPATVLRLKSCFGRGLLLIPAGAPMLAEKENFLLKFPAN